jgi:hypothetical protein
MKNLTPNHCLSTAPTYVDHLTTLNKYTAGLHQARRLSTAPTVEDVQNMMEHVINTVDEVSDAITYSATIQRYGRMIFSIGGHGQTNIDITEGV